ncbi:MAG: hypothetical protein AAF127_09405 [Pseudomonadota bacterium]
MGNTRQRRERRSNPRSTVQDCPEDCTAICAEKAKVERFQDEANIADAMYDPIGERNVPGYTEITDPDELAKLDLSLGDLHPNRADLLNMGMDPAKVARVKESGFRAGVFQNNETGDYAIGFKGTTFTSVEDWKNNAQQGISSRSDYYTRAKSIGRRASNKAGSGSVGDVKYIGHSLGGGLASAAAHTGGSPATTFNSAGLHGFNRSWFNAPPIDAVRVNGEVLTALQGAVPLLAPDAVGTPYKVKAPSNVASTMERADLNGWDAVIPGRAVYKYGKAAVARSVELHGMDAVKDALTERHSALAGKAAAGGCSC